MTKPFYVKYEVPKEIVDAAYEALQIASKTGIVRKGTNEATKAIERGLAKLVVIAEDVEPPEVVAHLPIPCDERKTPYVFVPTRKKLGAAVNIDVPAASVCITEEGDAANLIKEIAARIEGIRRGKQKDE